MHVDFKSSSSLTSISNHNLHICSGSVEVLRAYGITMHRGCTTHKPSRLPLQLVRTSECNEFKAWVYNFIHSLPLSLFAKIQQKPIHVDVLIVIMRVLKEVIVPFCPSNNLLTL